MELIRQRLKTTQKEENNIAVNGCQDIDRGMKEIREQIAALSKLQVKVGIIEGSGEVDGTDIAQYAAYNEFGVPGKKKKWNIPPRPFIRGWIENNQDKIKAMQDRLYKKVSEGKMSADEAIKKLGQYAQDGIKRYIRNGEFEPNAESTVRRKGSSRPLIDTGTMRNSVRYEVLGK